MQTLWEFSNVFRGDAYRLSLRSLIRASGSRDSRKPVTKCPSIIIIITKFNDVNSLFHHQSEQNS